MIHKKDSRENGGSFLYFGCGKTAKYGANNRIMSAFVTWNYLDFTLPETYNKR